MPDSSVGQRRLTARVLLVFAVAELLLTPSDDALQIDFVVAGRQTFGEAKSFMTWNVVIGDGSGENIMAFAFSDANAVLDASGKLDTMQALSIVLSTGAPGQRKMGDDTGASVLEARADAIRD